VQVEFWWGDVESVPLERVVLFRDYLDSRQHVFSLRRTQLCEAFFNNPLYRLREERVRKIQGAMREHGVAFRPNRWPTPDTRIRLWRDDSVVLDKRTKKDQKFDALLPHWLEAQKLPPSSRDPLGFQAHAERLANELLPGLTVFTSRIGYYGLLARAIQVVNGLPCPVGQTRQELLHRLERALVLCEFVYHGAEDNFCPLLGQRSRTQVLQNAEGDRFHVPKRILKNQASAGAYRLYFTSMNSLGFVDEATDLGADGLLPLTITDLGAKLARAFDHQLDDKFAQYALGEGTLDRRTIRSWGKRLCFSKLGGLGRYREPFLKGFLLGNSPEAEKRYRTVQRLFGRGLLTGDYEEHVDDGSPITDAVAEEDARAVEEVPAIGGLGNSRVLLRFYEETPSPDNRDFQVAATFELLAVGLASLFQVMVEELRQCGKAKPANLAARLAEEGQLSESWTCPVASIAARAPKAGELARRLLKETDLFRRAALGGVLLGRVLYDRTFVAVADDLADNPALLLADAVLRSRPERSLTEAYPDLVGAMVERHEIVSVHKNRQRWCCMDGETVVKDDLQAMQVGFHSFRFPQLYSLCRDLDLHSEDLRNGL
jgi:hypothetical protein